MSHERHFNGKGRLLAGINGEKVLTKRGRLALDLVRFHIQLEKHKNPKVDFAMSDEMVERYTLERDKICEVLDMPKDPKKRNRRVASYKRNMGKRGFYYWKIS